MKSPIDDTLRQMLQAKLEALEQYLHADVFVYYGSLAPVSANMFAKLVEDLKADAVKNDKLYVILTTLGGSAEIVERYVNILRYHYSEINFIVPDYAYSAGTIFSNINVFGCRRGILLQGGFESTITHCFVRRNGDDDIVAKMDTDNDGIQDENWVDDLKDVLLDCKTLQSNTQQQKFRINPRTGRREIIE